MEELKLIDTKLLAASPTQPRKHFNEKELNELTESIRQRGVVQPILVRPWPNEYPKPKGKKPEYEIVDGERRYRANIAVGSLTISCLVRDMSTEDVIETQMIGHLHRADLHPLEEAEAFEKILAGGKYDAKELASKVGKSASHVYQRIALNKLIDEAKELMWKDKLNAHQGLLIARCLPDFQQKILNQYGWRLDSGTVSAADIFNFIESNSYCILKNAPFRTDDESLVASAGSCAACSKRSGNNVDLFNDVAGEDTCTDKPCYDSKVQAQIDRVKEEISAKGVKPVLISTAPSYEKKPKGSVGRDDYEFCGKSEPGAVQAVVVAGSDLGKKKYVKLKEKEPAETKPKVNKAEREFEEQLHTAQRQEIIRTLFEVTSTHSNLSEDFWEHFAENRIDTWERGEVEMPTGKKWKELNTVQKIAIYYLIQDLPSYSSEPVEVSNNKFWKAEFGIDTKKICSTVEKELKKAKPEQPEEQEELQESTGKARKSKLAKKEMEMQ